MNIRFSHTRMYKPYKTHRFTAGYVIAADRGLRGTVGLGYPELSVMNGYALHKAGKRVNLGRIPLDTAD